MQYSKVSEERQKLKFEDTNLANFGTEMEYKVKKNAAEKEPAWEGTRTYVGIQIWRIEKFQIKAWPITDYGKFYDGDSYIVLHTKKDLKGDKLIYHAFMWIGQFSSQDEYGTAAYKIVELDDYLDRKATLFREVQGYESEEFCTLFNNRIQILNGGIETGFTHVEKITEFPGHLYHVRKNEQVYRITEVTLNSDSLNNDDCFVLDKGCDIYIFFGATCSSYERFKTATFVKDLREGRSTYKTQTFEVNALQDLEYEHVKKFWELLGGIPKTISEKEKGKAQESFENKLIKVSDSTGQIERTLVASGKISKDKLDSNDVFIVDTITTLFCWIGNKSSKDEKKQSFIQAGLYIKENQRPGYLNIMIINEGEENQSFLKIFA
jgi:gelsolin